MRCSEESQFCTACRPRGIPEALHVSLRCNPISLGQSPKPPREIQPQSNDLHPNFLVPSLLYNSSDRGTDL